MTDSAKPDIAGATPDPPLQDHVERVNGDPVLRRLMLLVSVAVVLGAIGTFAAVFGATQTRNASRADVGRNSELIRELAELEQAQSDNHTEHRRRNEALHADLCRLIYEIVQTSPNLRGQGITPCSPALPDEALEPEPVGRPSPTPSP